MLTVRTDEEPAKKSEEQIEREMGERVTEARIKLWAHLAEAHNQLDGALKQHHRLNGNEAFDVEYAGGGDFADHLSEVSFLLDIARGLMPTDKQGEMAERTPERAAVEALLRTVKDQRKNT